MDAILDLPIGWAILLLSCGAFLRGNGTYWVGRGIIAGGRMNKRARRYLDSGAMKQAERFSRRFGPFAVPLSFLTVGVQTAVNLSAGALRMPLRRYLPAVALGAFFWGVLYATIGLAVFQMIVLTVLGSPYVLIPLVILAAVVVTWLLVRRRLERVARTPADAEAGDPDSGALASAEVGDDAAGRAEHRGQPQPVDGVSADHEPRTRQQ